MRIVSLTGFVQGNAQGVVQGRQSFSINVKCDDKMMMDLIEKRLKNFLNNDNIFCTALEDITNSKTHTGELLVAFLVGEKIAETEAGARRLISGGNVRRKDSRGNWKIVGNVEAEVRPGWWKVTRKGMIKIGEDGIVEKRLESGGVFSKPISSSVS